MMGTLYTQILLVLSVILIHSKYVTASNSSFVGKPKLKCIESERTALLSFKKHLHSYAGDGEEILSSWGNEERKKECCKWLGIRCDIDSGHVVELDLSPSTFHTDYYSLTGKISTSLLELRYLTRLDLSYIVFTGSQIPSSIGTLRHLRYLNLSDSYFHGEIPPQLANLSSLRVLDLSYNQLLTTKNLEWLFHLSSLTNLDLTLVNLSRAHNWIEIFNELPNLTNLRLEHCNLPNNTRSPSLSFVNSSTSLAVLDLTWNDLSISIYQWLFNFSDTLVHLDLSTNLLDGPIPEAFSKMTSLTHLDLGSNKLNGSIPDGLGKMTGLTYLDLGNNKLEGEIPKFIWNISTLQVLDMISNNLSGHLPKTAFRKLKDLRYLELSINSFHGVISEDHFSNLSKLHHLGLALNQLTIDIHPDWILPFQLDFILLGHCKLGPQFPKWLRSQTSYSILDISHSGISDSIPNWFWDLSDTIQSMDLSNNQITGEIVNTSLEFQGYPEIDLSSNLLEGSVPSFLFSAVTLNLLQNGFSNLDLLCNINGDTPLQYLDISNNKLSGKLPDCWSHFKELEILILVNNKLSGKVPSSIGSLTMIETLGLANNSFTGELPSTLENCTNLVVVDFGENKLSGPIPKWIRKTTFTQLIVLSLRSNHFDGSMPSNLCHLSNLQLLDLSRNEMTGSIPKCIGSISAMKESRDTETTTGITHEYILYKISEWEAYVDGYEDNVQLQWKGTLTEFKNNLGLVKSIDLSSNKLIGEIPREIADLVELVSLNLSRNYLTGQMPSNIGLLRSLEVLDFSRNHLVGQIPSSLTQIDRLSTFDVSNNNLSGKIPTSTQLQSFPSTAYMGNPLLCGDPLPYKCQKDGEQTALEVNNEEEADDDELLTRGFYISMAIGFAVSFWLVSGTLIFHKSFRYSYFNLLNDAGDFISVRIATFKAKLPRIIRS